MFLIVIIQIVFRGVGVVCAGVGELKLIVVTFRRFLMVHVGEVQLGGEAALPGHPLPHLTNVRNVLGHVISIYQ